MWITFAILPLVLATDGSIETTGKPPCNLMPAIAIQSGDRVQREVEAESQVSEFLKSNAPTVGDFARLAKYGPRASLAMGELVDYSRSEQRSIRIAAINAMAQIGIGSEKALKALAQLALFDSDAEVRSIAVSQLAKIGFPEADTISTITVALTDDSALVRVAGLQAIYDAKGTVCHFQGSDRAVMDALHDADAKVRLGAVRLINRESHVQGNIPRSVIEQLSLMTDDDGKYTHMISGHFGLPQTVQYDVLWTLGTIGQDAMIALPAVLARIEAGKGESISVGQWEKVRITAARASYLISKDASLALDPIRDGLTSDNVQIDALHLVGEIGPAAEGLLPEVLSNLKHESPIVRVVACKTIPQLGRRAVVAKSALRAVIDNDEDRQVVDAAKSALQLLNLWPASDSQDAN